MDGNTAKSHISIFPIIECFPRSIEALGPILEALKAGEEKYEN